MNPATAPLSKLKWVCPLDVALTLSPLTVLLGRLPVVAHSDPPLILATALFFIVLVFKWFSISGRLN